MDSFAAAFPQLLRCYPVVRDPQTVLSPQPAQASTPVRAPRLHSALGSVQWVTPRRFADPGAPAPGTARAGRRDIQPRPDRRCKRRRCVPRPPIPPVPPQLLEGRLCTVATPSHDASRAAQGSKTRCATCWPTSSARTPPPPPSFVRHVLHSRYAVPPRAVSGNEEGESCSMLHPSTPHPPPHAIAAPTTGVRGGVCGADEPRRRRGRRGCAQQLRLKGEIERARAAFPV